MLKLRVGQSRSSQSGEVVSLDDRAGLVKDSVSVRASKRIYLRQPINPLPTQTKPKDPQPTRNVYDNFFLLDTVIIILDRNLTRLALISLDLARNRLLLRLKLQLSSVHTGTGTRGNARCRD